MSKSPVHASLKSLWSCHLCCCGLFACKLLVLDKHIGSPLHFAAMFGETLEAAERRLLCIKNQQKKILPARRGAYKIWSMLCNVSCWFFWGKMKACFQQNISQRLHAELVCFVNWMFAIQLLWFLGEIRPGMDSFSHPSVWVMLADSTSNNWREIFVLASVSWPGLDLKLFLKYGQKRRFRARRCLRIHRTNVYSLKSHLGCECASFWFAGYWGNCSKDIASILYYQP